MLFNEVNDLTKNEQLLLIDGMALLFRAFYATAPYGQYMYNDAGIPTNGVYGMLCHLFSAAKYFQPSHWAVCWDMGKKTFRNEIFKDYKANREDPPEPLIPQFELAKQAVRACSIPNIGVTGYEADDCLGTIAHHVKDEIAVTILTGDRDLLQMLDDQVSVAFLKKGYGNYEVYTKERFRSEYGFEPEQWIDIKAFTGDAADNYPGVKGIGPKTAEKLIREFSTVENVLDSLDQIRPALRKKIETDLEALHLSKQLATIDRGVPLQFSLEDAIIDVASLNNSKQWLDTHIKGTTRIFDILERWIEEFVSG